MTTTPLPRDLFRIQLLLALPDAGLRRIPAAEPAGRPSDIDPDADLFDQHVPLEGYSAEALAAWVLEQFDALEHSQAPAIEAAGAAGVLSMNLEFHRYLTALAGSLREGLDLVQQRALAASVEEQAQTLAALSANLIQQWPQLLNLQMPTADLVAPDGTPLA